MELLPLVTEMQMFRFQHFKALLENGSGEKKKSHYLVLSVANSGYYGAFSVDMKSSESQSADDDHVTGSTPPKWW